MTRRTFSGCNKYQGLQEAIKAVIIEEEDVGEVDLVALPPEPTVVTDKEEDDDNIQSTAFPRDIPDKVEVFTNIETIDKRIILRKNSRNQSYRAVGYKSSQTTIQQTGYQG